MSKDYLQMFNQFFSKKRRMASTYKPIFLRSLLDIGDLHNDIKAANLVGKEWLEIKGDRLLVDLNFVAVRFAKYYWDMEFSFRLRQAQDPQDANITRFIKQINKTGKKPPTIKDLAGEEMTDFRTKVVTKSIKPEVLVHLKRDMGDLYTKVGPNTIELDKSVIEFFHSHKILIRNSLTNVLSSYLEKLNRSTPQISNKIDNDLTKRTVLNIKIQDVMKECQDSRCFYCNNKFQKPHVDHVIPFNYVFTTDPYNCVLACQHCNCTKSDNLPCKNFFDDVLERNDTVLKRNDTDSYLKCIQPPYNEESYARLFDTCKEDYNRNRFFDPS